MITQENEMFYNTIKICHNYQNLWATFLNAITSKHVNQQITVITLIRGIWFRVMLTDNCLSNKVSQYVSMKFEGTLAKEQLQIHSVIQIFNNDSPRTRLELNEVSKSCMLSCSALLWYPFYVPTSSGYKRSFLAKNFAA